MKGNITYFNLHKKVGFFLCEDGRTIIFKNKDLPENSLNFEFDVIQASNGLECKNIQKLIELERVILTKGEYYKRRKAHEKLDESLNKKFSKNQNENKTNA